MPFNPPYPWFGGKRRVADAVWRAMGFLDHYIEPFCGGSAVFLANGSPPKYETLNDTDCYIINFWRAVNKNPERIAEITEGPIAEADLWTRHDWLIENRERVRDIVLSDPLACDVQAAGWWVWGVCWWLGRDWCRKSYRAMPCLSSGGRGLTVFPMEERLQVLKQMRERVSGVRITCGDWSRVVQPSITKPLGMTGIFLDPPYADEMHTLKYSGGNDVWNDVCAWCEDNGYDERLRIILCGYADSWEPPKGWTHYSWSSSGGYGLSSEATMERARTDTVWFSPHCIKEASLF